MRGESLDDGIASLERALRGLAGPEPTEALREWVMSGVDKTLSEPAPQARRSWLGGADLVGWAAIFLIGLVLARVAVSATSFFDSPVLAPSMPAVRATAELLRQVNPGLPPDEANRLALASAYRGVLVPLPTLEGGSVVRRADLPPAPGTPPFFGDVR